MTAFFCKAMARWAMHLYLGVADSPMRRYVLDDDELDDWRWLPDTGCAAEPRPRHGWLSYDVCEAAARRLRRPQAWLAGRWEAMTDADFFEKNS